MPYHIQRMGQQGRWLWTLYEGQIRVYRRPETVDRMMNRRKKMNKFNVRVEYELAPIRHIAVQCPYPWLYM